MHGGYDMLASALGMLAQMAEAVEAVADESDPTAWVMKVSLLAAFGATGYMGKLMLERPRPAEVNRLREMNDRLREELKQERARRHEAERELSASEITAVELRMILRQHNIDVPE